MTSALVSKGLQVTIVTTNNGVSEDSIKLDSWLNKIYGKIIYLKTRIHYFPIRLLAVSFLQVPKVQVIHLTSIFYPASILMAFWGLVMGKKIVWSTRGELYPSALVYNSYLKKVILFLVNRMKNKITFHSTCKKETLYIQDELGIDTKTIQIPNFMELPDKVNRKDEKYFLFLGRIHPIKGLDNLIEALESSELFIQSDFNLKIVGNKQTDYGELLISKIERSPLKDKVEFVGYVDDKILKQQIIANAHYLILPSKSENFGNVVVEALAQGTPVIASKGTPWEMLNTTEAGFWIDNFSDSIKSTIEEVLTQNKLTYDKFRVNAYKLASEEFDISKNISKWTDFYKSILDND